MTNDIQRTNHSQRALKMRFTPEGASPEGPAFTRPGGGTALQLRWPWAPLPFLPCHHGHGGEEMEAVSKGGWVELRDSRDDLENA